MYILNLEDNVYKHSDIKTALKSAGISNLEIDFVRNLEDGLWKIEEQSKANKAYDLIITDMWYPKEAGGEDEASGELLIARVREEKLNIPIILCSSVRYDFPGIVGTVHYGPNGDWESELVRLVKSVQ